MLGRSDIFLETADLLDRDTVPAQALLSQEPVMLWRSGISFETIDFLARVGPTVVSGHAVEARHFV